MTDEEAEARYYEDLLGHDEPDEINRDVEPVGTPYDPTSTEPPF